MLVIDTANVLGSRPSGWWRDRAAATKQLVERVRVEAAAGRLTAPIVMVLEGAARRGVEEGVAYGVEVVHAPGAGDDTLTELVAGVTEHVIFVSADRGLRDRVRRPGVKLVGPNWLLDQLD